MGGALCKRPNDLARAVQRRRYIIGRRSSIDGDRERVDYLTVDSPDPLQSFPLIRRQRIFEPGFIEDPTTMEKKEGEEKRQGYGDIVSVELTMVYPPGGG